MGLGVGLGVGLVGVALGVGLGVRLGLELGAGLVGVALGPGVAEPLPKTWNSQSETPYRLDRLVAWSRTYRPVADTSRVCTPPLPAVVLWIVFHRPPPEDVWIRNAVA